MAKINIKKEIENLVNGITDENEKQNILADYFRKKGEQLRALSEQFKNTVADMSDDELDGIAGGTYIGDIYGDCEEYENQCKSLLVGGGIDICQAEFMCDDDDEDDEGDDDE